MDIHERFRAELREQQLPPVVTLRGNAMQVAIATQLLAPHITVGDGLKVECMSMQAYGSGFLKSFLEEHEPSGHTLLYTIPEEELVAYAQRHGIPVVREEVDDVRRMLDRIAEKQPQTYLSLARSAQRLRGAAELLRKDVRS